MKQISCILMAAAIAAVSFSCTKGSSDSPAGDGKIHIDITGEMGEFSPGVTKSEVVSVMRVDWKGGEKVYVYGQKKNESVISYLGELTATDVESEGRVAVLSGIIEEPVSGTILSLLHSPCFESAPAVTDGKISVDMATQSSEKVDFIVCASVPYTETGIEDLKTPFTFATSVLKVNVSGLRADKDITSASLSSIETSCDITVTASEGASVSKSESKGKISKALETTSHAGGTASFWMSIPIISSGSHTLTVAQDSDTSLVTGFLKSGFTNGSCLNATVVAYSTSDVSGENPDEGRPIFSDL